MVERYLSAAVRTFLLIIMLHGAGAAFGQQTVNYASAGGIVTDPAGDLSPAQRSARARSTPIRPVPLTTDADGRFRFPYLRPGAYEFTVRDAGFADARRSITLTVGAAVELNVSLTLASVETTLNVSDQKEVLDTSRTEIAGTVQQTEVTDLPVNGRNFLDIALVVPGVSPTNTASNQLFAETSAVPGQGISVEQPA